jgi:hypothetical protein
MYCCHLVADPDQHSAVVIRVHRGKLAGVMDHNAEVIGIHVNYLSGCGVPLYAKFNNGLILGYAPGQQLRRKDLDDPAIVE